MGGLRKLREEDFGEVSAALDGWWGEREMSGHVPRLFFRHFRDTSFVVEEAGGIRGFLIGFVSPSVPGEAYVHFAGVHPEYRGRGVARSLYEAFFREAREKGCEVVRCVTSPVNRDSVAFHESLGFELEEGDAEAAGIPVATDHDGEGRDRVLFARRLE
jgi:ribosomal protein S18 acetylase RimI-like enzyme